MKKIFIILCNLLLSLGSLAQNLEWVKAFGGVGVVLEGFNTVDASGNVYTTGHFSGTVDFDPGPGTTNLTSAGNQDVYVQKLDASGNFLWAKTFGGATMDNGNSITVDASGNVYTTGFFSGTVDFDPGVGTYNLTSNGGFHVYVQKLDASGNFLWVKTIGATSTDKGNSITLDASGNIYITGLFQGMVDFDPGVGTFNIIAGSSDVFVQKLDASGNFLWAKAFGGPTHDYGNSISVDASGNVYTTGGFQGTVDFDPGAGTTNLTSAGDYDVFVQKLDASGDFLWAKAFGGTLGEEGRSISVDASGNVYTTGDLQGTIDFDPGAGTTNLTSAGGIDFFVQKLDPSGNFLWAKAFGATSDDYGASNTVDASGNVYTTGYFSGTVDFDPGVGITNLTGIFDVFVQKLDASGNFLWAKAFGGNTFLEGQSISVDALGNVYTTGGFQGTVDFDPGVGTFNISAGSSYDVFVHKMSPCSPTTGTDVQTACNSFTWIDGNTYTSSNNSATFNIIGGAANGCDSLVTLDLTINNSTTGTDVQTACDSYTWIDGNTYTSSNNTATWTLTNAAGCDSVVTLDLTINNVSDITTSTSGITISANNTNAIYSWLDCDNNYAIINGETNISFTPSSNGNYAVQLIENGCIDTSACVQITTVGIIENTFKDQFTLYPNPTNGLFAIEFNATHENVALNILDASGRIIDNKNYNQVDLIEYELNEPKGLYLIELSDGKGQRSLIRLIKQ